MAAPGQAPSPGARDLLSRSSAPTAALLGSMLRAGGRVSDLVFSPGRPPQVEVDGQLLAVPAAGAQLLNADDTRRIASELIGNNKQAITMLREQGSCDVSFAVPGLARFRVNVFIQRGSCAVVMRVIPTTIPDFGTLGLPPELKKIAGLRDGIVLISGARGSGKSSTLATLLDRINEEHCCHIITIEDPIEFLHNHKKATVHQRELHSDAPNFGLALRATLRQAPRVILLGEIRDRDTMETALEAAETGHLILSTVNASDASKTVTRIVGLFPSGEGPAIRGRLAKTLRYVVSQRLLPRRDGGGRAAAVEILRVTARTMGHIEAEDPTGHSLQEAIKSGVAEGMQYFDAEIHRLVADKIVDFETALGYATDPQGLRQALRR
jgi:twitching motility protein PilT